MSRHRTRKSKSKQSEFVSSMADDFEATALHNNVYDSLNGDDELAQLCDAAAAADTASNCRDETVGGAHDHTQACEEAWGHLSHVARERALEVVAECCATVINDGDEWVGEGHWDAEEIADAKHEAREWLQTHTNVAERVGALEVA